MLTFSHSYILLYRLVCLILSVGYFLYQFTEANYNNFGIQFRYLTIWGLTTAMVATLLLYKSKHRGLPESYLPFVSATAVLNAMVVFLYWKLYFIDPSLVNYSGSIVWFQECYLHILGPALIILDALLFNNSFTELKKGVLTILAICLLYILWSESFKGPLNAQRYNRGICDQWFAVSLSKQHVV
ncbi:androgen-induced gene 1 family protein [Rhodobacteraceae bacterium]|nr:androgen-induced gene 1 family protein [Paracoccaceae bacterium]